MVCARGTVMGKYYKSTDEMYKILGALFERVKNDAEVGKKLQAAKIAVRFRYKDPEGAATIDAKTPPAEGAGFFEYNLGAADAPVDVELINSADFAHRFWHGKENAVVAIALGKMKAKGDINKALALLPVIKPVFRMFPKVLQEMGRNDLVLR